MKVQKRKADQKRHTIGYKISGKWRTRKQAWELAEAGKIDGVTACQSGKIRYIQSLPGHKNLYDLPVIVEE